MLIGIDIRNIGKQRTGDETVFFNLVKNLAEIDNKNGYRLFTDITDATVLQYVREKLGIEKKNNFQIVSLKTANKFTWNLWTLPRYLRANPVDIYHTQYILPFCVSRKIKLITLIHDISFNFYPGLIKWKDLLFLKILIPWSLKRADQILAVSEFTKKEIRDYYHVNPEKIAVVPNSGGEDLNTEIAPEELNSVKEKYHLPEKFILYLGTMQPRKNLSILLEALSKLKNSEWKLVLAGKKNDYNQDPQIKATIRKFSLEKKVIFTGFMEEEEKIALFRLARVFCFPSLYEGFGIPILEAMKAGTPAVVSDISPHHEVAGDAVLYFSPKNVEELKNKIIELDENTDLRERLIRGAETRAQIFSWKKTAEKTLAIYQKLGNKT
ncbi:glycosyltransferase family 4 protein [Patescibacteria group bacterium]|nr:glycosyltransferase family 4 protein [Patescibacteria group bacterium]